MMPHNVGNEPVSETVYAEGHDAFKVGKQIKSNPYNGYTGTRQDAINFLSFNFGFSDASRGANLFNLLHGEYYEK